MNYFIKRDQQEYGPYTLADLQRYVAQGNILMSDLARSEGMTDWVPVSQIIGNIPVQAPLPAAVYVPQGAAAVPVQQSGAPNPPNLHWGLVLLFTFLSCGIFAWVWIIMEAVWVRKIRPQSKGLLFVVIALACDIASFSFGGFSTAVDRAGNPGGLFSLAGLVLILIGVFQMRKDLEEYYNSVEPIHLQLSGVMTFFFAVFYFQYHFTRINNWKRTGILQPQ